jgi:hypothetical protein
MPSIDETELEERVEGVFKRVLSKFSRGNHPAAFSSDDDHDIDVGNPPASIDQVATALQSATAERDALKAKVEALTAENERLSGFFNASLDRARAKVETVVTAAFGQGDTRIESAKKAAAGMSDPEAVEAYAETLAAQAPPAFTRNAGTRLTQGAGIGSGEEGTAPVRDAAYYARIREEEKAAEAKRNGSGGDGLSAAVSVIGGKG